MTARRRRSTIMACISVAANVMMLGWAATAHAHGEVMRIGSSVQGGGQLLIDPDFDFGGEVHLAPGGTIGDLTLYTAIIPSFAWILEPQGSPAVFPLPEDVVVNLTVAAVIAPEASVRIGGRLLNAPAETGPIGSFSPDPEDHVHPEWQVVLPTGTVGSFTISFKITTAKAGFTESPTYTFVLTNADPPDTPTVTATPPTTPTPTPTEAATDPPTPTVNAAASPTASPIDTASPTATVEPTGPPASCAGDCDGDGSVRINELVLAVNLALNDAGVETCEAADRNRDGTIAINELVGAVGAALNGCAQA